MDQEKVSSYKMAGDKNSYEWCLEEAGAEVLAFNEFGSYQGDWYAKVRYQGKTFWIHDYYGSCSGCDAFEADAGYQDKTKEEWKQFCIKFCEDYLAQELTFEQALADANKNTSWDADAKEAVAWIKENE